MSHGAVKSHALMGVVGRDQARRGQPVAKPVTQSVAQPVRHRERHQEQDRESHHEKDREMLARVKEFDADIDIDMGTEPKLPKLKFGQEFDQELKQYCTSPGESPLERRKEREMRRDSCGKVQMVFTEGDDIRVLGATVSFKTSRRRAVRTRSQVMCDSCELSVSSFQGCLLSESGQSQFKRGQFIRTGCLMMTGIEHWESYECNKPGHLRNECSVYKKRIAEKGHKPKGERIETIAVVQGCDGRNVGV